MLDDPLAVSLIAPALTYRSKTMARLLVRMYATVREASGVSSIEIDASDLDELMQRLGRRFGHELSRILESWSSDGDGIVILVNGRNIGPGRSRNARLVDGDEVAIFPPVSGG